MIYLTKIIKGSIEYFIHVIILRNFFGIFVFLGKYLRIGDPEPDFIWDKGLLWVGSKDLKNCECLGELGDFSFIIADSALGISLK